jgi:hypothetical protein
VAVLVALLVTLPVWLLVRLPVTVAVPIPVLPVLVPMLVLVAVCGAVGEQSSTIKQSPTPLHTPQLPQAAPSGKTQAPMPSQIDWQGAVPLPHSFSGSAPTGKGPQAPTLPTSLHETQVPVQALSQHTPSLQNPLAHAAAPAQAEPLAALHDPVASHAWSPEQLPATWVPAAASTQVPSLPGTLQDLHGPEHEADSQHTPSTQLPEAHWLANAAVHPVPLPQPVTLYSQVSSVAMPYSMPPNKTITPRWLSRAMAAYERSEGSPAGGRADQVGPLLSNSQVDMFMLPYIVVAVPSSTTRRRIES